VPLEEWEQWAECQDQCQCPVLDSVLEEPEESEEPEDQVWEDLVVWVEEWIQ
jgi:hypothetical protein